jgi:D-glycero-alpha-D-manno-heptose 1-phosphate guanylyltransferase
LSARIKTAIILAGGFGTRLQTVVSEVPKPMAPIAGRPFLEYLLDYLIHFGFEEVVLSTGHLSEVVSDHFGEAYKSLAVKYAVETDPLGTGGAILNSFRFTDATQALVLNGDSFLNAPLDEVLNQALLNDYDGLMVLREMPTPDRFGTVKLGTGGLVEQFEEKKAGLDSGLINAGIYILDRDTIAKFGLKGRFSIEDEFFKPYTDQVKIAGFVADGYFIDIGIPGEYDRAQSDFKTFQYS